MCKFLAAFISLTFLFITFSSPANAEKCVLFKDGKKSGVIKKTFVEGEKVYLQSREAAKRIGGKIDFLPASGKTVFKTKTIQVVFEEGSDNVITNGIMSSFDKPVIVKSAVPYFSAEYFVSDIFMAVFGSKIEFDCEGRKFPAEQVVAEPVPPEQNEPEKNVPAKRTEITGIAYGSHKGYSRIVLELDSPIDPNDIEQVGYADNFYIMQIKGGVSTVKNTTGRLGKEVVSSELSMLPEAAELKIGLSESAGRVEWEQMDKNEEANRPYRLKIDIFELKPGETREGLIKSDEEDLDENSEEAQEENKGVDEQKEKAEQISAEEVAEADYSNVKELITEEQKKGKKIIVIDAGHGGKDSGTSFREKIKKGTRTVYKFKSGKKTFTYTSKNACIKKHGKSGRKNCVQAKETIYANGPLVLEKNINLAQAKELQAFFEKDSKFKVVLTRPLNKDIELCKNPNTSDYQKDCKPEDLHRRNEIAIENNADIFISLHINGLGNQDVSCDKRAGGFEILYRSAKKDIPKGKDLIEMYRDLKIMDAAIAESKALAESIVGQLDKVQNQTHIKHGKGAIPDIKTGKTDFVLRSSRFPAVIVESGYLCNSNDRKWLQDAKVRKKIAEAIYKAVLDYGKQKKWKGF